MQLLAENLCCLSPQPKCGDRNLGGLAHGEVTVTARNNTAGERRGRRGEARGDETRGGEARGGGRGGREGDPLALPVASVGRTGAGPAVTEGSAGDALTQDLLSQCLHWGQPPRDSDTQELVFGAPGHLPSRAFLRPRMWCSCLWGRPPAAHPALAEQASTSEIHPSAVQQICTNGVSVPDPVLGAEGTAMTEAGEVPDPQSFSPVGAMGADETHPDD